METGKASTLKQVKELIEKGLRFELLLDYLRKNNPELHEELQKASAKHYTSELSRLVSDKAEGLIQKLEELYRDRKLEELVTTAVRTEIDKVYREMESRKKRGRTVEFLLFVGIAFHITLISAGLAKMAILVDIAMLFPLYLLYREGS